MDIKFVADIFPITADSLAGKAQAHSNFLAG